MHLTLRCIKLHKWLLIRLPRITGGSEVKILQVPAQVKTIKFSSHNTGNARLRKYCLAQADYESSAAIIKVWQLIEMYLVLILG